MEVIICKGQTRAIHPSGEIFPIAGIQIESGERGKVFYGPETSFYKAAVASGTRHQAILTHERKFIIL